jgi:hypothetical protein
MDRRDAALFLSKLADVPGSNVDTFIKLGRGNAGGPNAFLKRKQTFGNFGRNVSVIHGRILS